MALLTSEDDLDLVHPLPGLLRTVGSELEGRSHNNAAIIITPKGAFKPQIQVPIFNLCGALAI